MGVSLVDRDTDETVLDVNFWHWRAIVEAIRRLHVLPDERARALHDQWMDSGLTREEARLVAAAMRSGVLPTLRGGERLLLDGKRTTEPDDFKMYYAPDERHKNYSTDRAVLEEFVACCERCNGFLVY
jgi:hypothetical protein